MRAQQKKNTARVRVVFEGKGWIGKNRSVVLVVG